MRHQIQSVGENPARKRMRLPLPAKAGRPQTTPKGLKGYDRKNAKREISRIILGEIEVGRICRGERNTG
jgi:hypothetical protein